MPDREKVINALGRCESYGYCEDMDCPYYKNTNCLELLRKDALTLLKEQEAVPVDTKMADKNTVMSWLEGLTWDDWPKWHSDSEVQETAKAALKVLKGLDAKRVLSDRQCEISPHHYERKGFCPKCHQEVKFILNRNYCGFCGQAVKWNDNDRY